MNRNVRARQQQTVRVIHVHFDQQGSRRRIDRARVANQRAMKHASRIFVERKRRRGSGPRGIRVNFGNRHENTQGGNRRQMKQLFTLAQPTRRRSAPRYRCCAP